MLPNSPQESEEGADHGGRFVCPLCTLDFSSPEKLISHVYQVRARECDGLETQPTTHSFFLSLLFSKASLLLELYSVASSSHASRVRGFFRHTSNFD